MTSMLQFVEKMAKAPALVESAQKEMVAAAALVVTTSIRAETSLATHGTNRLSGVGRKGAKIGVGFDVKGTKNPTALITARGPFHLIERDTAAHDIRPRKRGKRALATPDGPRAGAHVKGTRGKHPFEKGVAAGLPGIRLAGDVVMTKTLAKILGSVG